MLDDVSDIASFYDEGLHAEHQRLEEHQLEWSLSWRILDQHLPPKGRVLDVGASTGRYSLELARRGHEVIALDLSAGVLNKARELVESEGLTDRVRFVVADARDLAGIEDASIDAVLMMGPLYHLVEQADRRLAVREANRVLKTGGVLFSAFLSRLGVLGDLMRRSPAWIEDEVHVRSYLDRGMRPKNSPAGGFRGYFARVSEIAPLHESEGFATQTLAGVEPVISAHDESFNQLPPAQRASWLDVLEEVCMEDSILGASRHLLYVGTKL